MDFMDDVAVEAENSALAEVMDWVTKWDELTREIDVAEEKLKRAKEREQDLSLKIIPELLLKNGLDNLNLSNGRRVEVKEKVYISMPKDEGKKREVIDFLMNNGGGDLVKDKITINDAPESIKGVLQEKAIPFDHTQDVNTNSFVAWSKSALGMTKGSVQRIAQGDFPKAANLFIRREAEIK